MRTVLIVAVLLLTACSALSSAQQTNAALHVLERVVAGTPVSIPTGGTGKATFYLIGPGHIARREIELGSVIEVGSEETRDAGRYTVLIRRGASSTQGAFYVVAADPESLSFLARPSRLPVAVPEGISGVVYPFDRFHNLVLQPKEVNFRLSVGENSIVSRNVLTKNGVAWTRIDSNRKAGRSQLVASIGELSARRVVQEVASDPCNLRIGAQLTAQGILVRTEPILDCAGNAVPDGTIVTFTAREPKGKTTVDVPIKRGIAQAELPLAGSALISVASGVVIGNQIRWGGER
jgi:hypothetical protein